MKKNIRIIAVLGLLILLTLTFVSRSVYNKNLPKVSAYKSETTLLPVIIETMGTLWYPDEILVKSGDGWRISQVLVKDGDLVGKGDLLLILDTYDHDIQIAAQELEMLRLKNALEVHVEAYDEPFKNSENQDYNKNRELQKLVLEMSELESEIDAIIDGSYSTFKTTEYNNNIKNAEDSLRAAQILFDMGGISQSELDTAENNLANIEAQYQQYIQTETHNKSEQIKSKQKELDSLRDAITHIEHEHDLYVKEKQLEKTQQERNWSRKLQELSAQLILSQKQMERSLQYPPEGRVYAASDGLIAGLTVEAGDMLSEGAVLMSLLPSAVPRLKFDLPPKEGEAFGTDSVINARIETVVFSENDENKFVRKTVTGRVYSYILKGGHWECVADLNTFEGQPVLEQDVPVQVVQKGEVQQCVVPIGCIFDANNDTKAVYSINTRSGLFGEESYVQEIPVDILYDNGKFASIEGVGIPFNVWVAGDISELLENGDTVWVRD